MKIAFNSTGTHLKKDQLKVRLDFYPDETEKTYQKHYVYVPVFPPEGYPGKIDAEGNPVDPKAYNDWVAALPHIWKLNPCLCAFIRVGQDVTKEILTEYIGDIYKSDVLATIDDSLIQTNSAHLISPYMRSKTLLSSAKTLTFDEQIKADINDRLAGFNPVSISSAGTIEEIRPQSIDVGSEAIDRLVTSGSLYAGNYITQISYNNPANATGTLDTVEAWFGTATAGNSCKIGTFSDGGSGTFTCNDAESIGEVIAGSKQTYSGLSIDINLGEYIGADARTAYALSLERDLSGYNGNYYEPGQYCDPSDSATFTLLSGDTLSLYGTGTESGGGLEAAFSAQTFREVLSAGSFSGQTLRAVTSGAGIAAQTQRIVKSLSGYSGQAVRYVSNIAGFNAQSERLVKSAASFISQTRRIVGYTAGFTSQTLRTVKSAATYSGQGLRLVKSLAGYTAQGLRQVTAAATYTAQTGRIIKSLAGYNAQSYRVVKSAAAFSAQTVREVLTSFSASFNAQALRIVSKTVSYQSQTKRAITGLADFAAQSVRTVKSLAAYSGGGLRIIRSAASFAGQAKRVITLPAAIIGQTVRAVKASASYDGQTSKIVKSAASYAAQTYRRVTIAAVAASYTAQVVRLLYAPVNGKSITIKAGNKSLTLKLPQRSFIVRFPH